MESSAKIKPLTLSKEISLAQPYLQHLFMVSLQVKCDLNIWYLDYGCIGGKPQTA